MQITLICENLCKIWLRT